MGYLLGQKRRKVGRLQRQAARCFLVTQEASSVELGTWCWPRAVLIEKRPLTESERSSMNRAVRSIGARRIQRLGRNNWIWRMSGERELIRERTGEGRKRAMANGVKFGRRPKLSPYQRTEAIKRRAAGETLASIARSYAVDLSMISRL